MGAIKLSDLEEIALQFSVVGYKPLLILNEIVTAVLSSYYASYPYHLRVLKQILSGTLFARSVLLGLFS